MKKSLKKGFSFGLTSAVIAALGLMVGLNSGTESRIAIITGMLIISITDSSSDAFGVHISEKSHKKNTSRYVWEATIATFLTKFIFTLSFLVPFFFFDLSTSVMVSVAWGIILLSILSYTMSYDEDRTRLGVVVEHLLIAIIVIVISYFAGSLIHDILA